MLRVVKTEYGYVRGTEAADPRVTAFKGIPFAAPPVGSLRWRAPQPASSWEGVRDCLEFAPISMQPAPGTDRSNIYSREWAVDPEIHMAEDCLYLNVWTPAMQGDEKLPVYVWYFGGGLQVGNTAEMEFDGERLARRGIVVVTVNYRVNVFGFLAHPELSKEHPEAPANFGHLDQQFGLKWTKRNIAAFGGDPDRITIGGQSAGGESVLTQLNCPDNENLIQGAIIESGVFYNPHQIPMVSSLEEMEKQGEHFFGALGVSSLEEARALPAERILEVNGQLGLSWGTVIDGAFQKLSYWEAIEKGNLLNVPILAGCTNNEFYGTARQSEDDLTEDNWEQLWKNSVAIVDYQEKVPEGQERISLIEMSLRMMRRYLEKAGGSSTYYFYEFGAEIPGWDDPGAFHSSDLWFFFETLAKCWRPFTGKHYDLSRQMCNYWAEFIKKGDPNGQDADGTEMAEWKPFTGSHPWIMDFYEMPRLQEKKPGTMMQKVMEKIEKQQ